jgi:hypothetical protein
MSDDPTKPNEDGFKLVIEQGDGDEIRDLVFETADGEIWPAFTPHAEIYQREEDGLWFVGWGNGSAGPLSSRQFAEQVAETMREGIIESAKPVLS